jgi:hypothetical protein
MADEQPVTGTTETPKTLRGMVLYKIDRTFAILGIIGLGLFALTKTTPDATQIAMAAIGGLVGYVGGRTAK